MNMQRALLSFLLLVATIGSAAEPPIEIVPEPYTNRQLREAEKRYWRDFYVGQYQLHGKKNEAWDQQAIELLERASMWENEYTPETATKEDLELARRLVKAGCEDTLVLLACSIAASQAEAGSNRLETLVRAEKAWRGSGYGLRTRLTIVYEMNAHHQWKPDAPRAQLHREIADALVAAVGGDSIAHEQVRFAYRSMDSMAEFLDWEAQEAMLEPLGKLPNADPWLVKMLTGRIHWRLAWGARGAKFGNPARPRRAGGYPENIEKARDCFLAAWQLEPKFPESSAMMIEMAANGLSPDVSRRTWFDRAIAAQCDFEMAYAFYLWHLRPRWGGANEAVYDFGVQCAKTKRYDTEVPLQLTLALKYIRDDLGGSWSWYAKPGVFPELLAALEGRQRYLEDHGDPNGLKAQWTEAWIAAYKIGRYIDARTLTDRFNGELDAETLKKYGINRELAHKTILAFTGAFKDKIADAHRLVVENGDIDGAVAIFEKIIAENTDEAIEPIFKGRSAMLRAQADLIAGRKALLPTDEIMSNWSVVAGSFKPQPNSGILARATWRRGIAFTPIVAGPRFEVEGNIVRRKGQKWRCCALFLADPNRLETSWRAYDWQPQDLQMAMRGHSDKLQPIVRMAPDGIPGKVRLQHWDGLVCVYIDDRLVLVEEPPVESLLDEGSDPAAQSPAIGVGILGRRKSDEALWESVTVRILKEQPDSPQVRSHRLYNQTYRNLDSGDAGSALDRLSHADLKEESQRIAHIRRSIENRSRLQLNTALEPLSFGKDREDWVETPGAWKIVDGKLIGTTGKKPIRRDLALDLVDYELRCKVDWSTSGSHLPTVEIILGQRPYQPAAYVRYSPTTGITHSTTPHRVVNLRKPDASTSMEITVRKRGRMFEFGEGSNLLDKPELEAAFGDRRGCIGFLVHSAKPGAEVSFSDIRITPLAATD